MFNFNSLQQKMHCENNGQIFFFYNMQHEISHTCFRIQSELAVTEDKEIHFLNK